MNGHVSVCPALHPPVSLDSVTWGDVWLVAEFVITANTGKVTSSKEDDVPHSAGRKSRLASGAAIDDEHMLSVCCHQSEKVVVTLGKHSRLRIRCFSASPPLGLRAASCPQCAWTPVRECDLHPRCVRL